MNMKSHKHGKIAVTLLLLFALLTTAVSAATPTTVEARWTNTEVVTCEIRMGTTMSYADATVEGRPGCTIEATLTLYRLYEGTASIGATWKATGEDVLFLTKPFVPMNGASYYLVLTAKVSYGGYTETINASDTAP